MRRLAQQTRDDVYASLRDYQEVHPAQGEAFRPARNGQHLLTFTAQASAATNSEFVGVGAYLNPSAAVRMGLTLVAGAERATITRELGGGHWNRVGVAVHAPATLPALQTIWDPVTVPCEARRAGPRSRTPATGASTGRSARQRGEVSRRFSMRRILAATSDEIGTGAGCLHGGACSYKERVVSGLACTDTPVRLSLPREVLLMM